MSCRVFALLVVLGLAACTEHSSSEQSAAA